MSPHDRMAPDAKLSRDRLARRAMVYLRQFTERQVQHNKESQQLQYALAQHAQRLGFTRVEVIDDDLGFSAAIGRRRREGFERLLAAVALGDVGVVFSRELSRAVSHRHGLVSVARVVSDLRHARHGKSWERDESAGPVRSGKGLLTGLLRCRRCGRKLHARYWGKSGTAARYLCHGDYELGGHYCLGFGGSTVDRHFAQQLLALVSPSGLEASMLACARLDKQDDARRSALTRQLEQVKYETMRAFEQYDQVDPRNRLVASELERRYNDKLEEQRSIEAKLAVPDATHRQLSDDERAQLLALGENFSEVWQSPHCPPELKKRIVRALVEEVLVDEQPKDTLDFIVHWKGGVHTRFTMPKPQAGVGEQTTADDLDVIRLMAKRYGDDQIARVLNKLGRRTGKGKPWSQQRVATARRNHGIAGQRHQPIDPDLFTLNGAARHLGVSDTAIRRLVNAGVLPCKQLAPWAPWEIRRCDLETPRVHAIVKHLLATGKLDLQGDRSTTRQTQFESFQHIDKARHHD